MNGTGDIFAHDRDDEQRWHLSLGKIVGSASVLDGTVWVADNDGTVYATDSENIDVPSEFRTIFIIVFVLAAGILWEVLEFALGGLITVYGIDDIVTELIFNAVGAVIVAIRGTDYVTRLVGFFGERFRST